LQIVIRNSQYIYAHIDTETNHCSDLWWIKYS